jgi:hypothetical protein
VMERLGAKTMSELVLLAMAAGLRPTYAAREAGDDGGDNDVGTRLPRG